MASRNFTLSNGATLFTRPSHSAIEVSFAMILTFESLLRLFVDCLERPIVTSAAPDFACRSRVGSDAMKLIVIVFALPGAKKPAFDASTACWFGWYDLRVKAPMPATWLDIQVLTLPFWTPPCWS